MAKSNKNPRKIYMDYAASVSPNPSSIHDMGVDVKNKLQNTRKIVADNLTARPSEIIFTSGGTESNNLAILGVVSAIRESYFSREYPASPRHHSKNNFPAPHIITTNIEHPSVLETCKHLGATIVAVEPNGIVDPKKIKKALTKNTVLVSVMYANNEIGTIQPIREIAKEIRHFNKLHKTKILFHTDAVQAVNYLDLNVERLGVDLLSLSGSKIEGAGRVGVLYKKAGVSLAPVFFGGDQENGLRPGTENVPEIIKFADAFAVAQKNKEKESKRLKVLQEYFFKKLCRTFFFSGYPAKATSPLKKESSAEFLLNGDLENRLPNNINITFPKIPSDLLVIELSAKGIMTSSKSACKSSSSEGSYVISAIHLEIDKDIGGLRFSFGKSTDKKDIDDTLKALVKILTKLKKWYN